MKKKPINWKLDPLSWLSHTAFTIAIYLVLGIMFNLSVGAAVACAVIYAREVSQNNFTFEFWLWEKWDSIIDFVIPIISISLLFNFLTLPLLSSLIS